LKRDIQLSGQQVHLDRWQSIDKIWTGAKGRFLFPDAIGSCALAATPPVGESMGLITETVVVTACAMAVVRFLHTNGALGFQWLAVPSVLVAAALVPAWLRKREFPPIGLDLDHSRLIAGTLGWVCLCIFPALVGGLWMLASLHLPLPLLPIIPQQQGWLAWLFYQFFYVAVAEEVFFRGYVQANIMRLVGLPSQVPMAGSGLGEAILAHPRCGIRDPKLMIPILVSAACFALAHVVVQGQITSALTFVPGLILAWLFLRTGTLLAPILFHGLANVAYALIGMALA
jgi:membrane protease YdiL (CAAX protease family)